MWCNRLRLTGYRRPWIFTDRDRLHPMASRASVALGRSCRFRTCPRPGLHLARAGALEVRRFRSGLVLKWLLVTSPPPAFPDACDRGMIGS
jgi:hypothetical protein